MSFPLKICLVLSTHTSKSQCYRRLYIWPAQQRHWAIGWKKKFYSYSGFCVYLLYNTMYSSCLPFNYCIIRCFILILFSVSFNKYICFILGAGVSRSSCFFQPSSHCGQLRNRGLNEKDEHYILAVMLLYTPATISARYRSIQSIYACFSFQKTFS